MKTTPYELVFGQPARSNLFPGVTSTKILEDVEDLFCEGGESDDTIYAASGSKKSGADLRKKSNSSDQDSRAMRNDSDEDSSNNSGNEKDIHDSNDDPRSKQENHDGTSATEDDKDKSSTLLATTILDLKHL